MSRMTTWLGAEASVFRRAFLAGAAAMALAVFPLASPANGHVVYESGTMLQFPPWCMRIRSEVSHGSHDGGYYKGNINTYGKSASTQNGCASSYSHGPHHLMMKMWQWFKPFGTPPVGVCSATVTLENTTRRSSLSQTINHGSSTPTCGHGFYENETRGWAMWNGEWRTASLFSGQHCLNASLTECSGK